MHFYVLKTKYSNAYYTVRNSMNVPAILAFPYAKPAYAMKYAITTIEKHKQPLEVEKVDGPIFLNSCETAMQSLVVITDEETMTLHPSVQNVSFHTAVRYFDHLYGKNIRGLKD